MKIELVTDESFAPYGKIITGYDVSPLVNALENETPLTGGVEYVPSEPALEKLSIAAEIQDNIYGGMPVQLGWCNGHNTKLNCLEYHRDSEINLGTSDFILLLAKQHEIIDGVLDTSKVRAFLCPKNTLLEVYATTLHYAPCSAKNGAGFKVMVVLPKGTNTDKPAITIKNAEDKTLWARNKWLLAHKDANEAKQGAYVGLVGENIDVAEII
ncbi:MAG: DUF4867 family protein [Clostridia bacterium]|nr:DUF4867 family protein [Clostridia bacterium]NLS84827.1 DUF4867 family protein [Oscillospiraceae bacterium]